MTAIDFQRRRIAAELHSRRQRVVELIHLVGRRLLSAHVQSELAAGGGYNFSALDFGHGQSRAGVQMFEGFVMYKFNPGLVCVRLDWSGVDGKPRI